MGLVALAGLSGCRGTESQVLDGGPPGDVGASCGNGRVDPGEGCDHAELNSDAPNAVCRTDCQIAHCGDAILDDARGEQCDLAQANSDTPDAQCRADCRLRRCGDAVIDPSAGELCDDGNTLSGDGCSADCRSDETCGNGIVWIADNDATGIIVWADMTTWVHAGDSYAVYDLRLGPGSPAIDIGDDATASATDFYGNPRYDAPGVGSATSISDIGAIEYQP